jgi:hypothetical protein
VSASTPLESGAVPTRFERWRYGLWPRGAAALPLPDFLGIGAQKAGTTWLWENLRRHPGVFVPERKELHYWDNKWERPLAYYAGRFAEGAGRVRGEITPAYGILPAERIRFIHRLLPDLRLVLLLRNPVDRAWSQLAMELGREGRKPEEVPADELVAFASSERALRRGDYTAILERWLAVFPEEQLLVGFFEEIREQPRALLRRVFEHLGVDAQPDWGRFALDEVIVPNPDGVPMARAVDPRPACPAALREALERRYEPDLTQLAARFGAPVERWRAGAAA